MGGELLDIHPRIASRPEVCHEVHQGDFGGVGHSMEHRLGRKKPPQRQTVGAPGQLAARPDFDAMGVAVVEELHVSRDHLRGEPGLAFASGGRRTAANHAAKVAVAGDRRAAAAAGPAKASGDMEIGPRGSPRRGSSRPPCQ